MQVEFIQPVRGAVYTRRVASTGMKNRIRELRLKRGLTLEQLAERVGASLPQIQKMETGERRLNSDWLPKLAEALKCDPSEIISTGNREIIYQADDVLFQKCGDAIVGAAKKLGKTLSAAAAITFTVILYRHVSKQKVEPTEERAILVLESNAA